MEKKTTQLIGILIVSMLTCASLVAVISLSPLDKGTYTYKLNTFQSYDELLAFLHKRYEAGTNQGRFYDNYNVAIENLHKCHLQMEQLLVAERRFSPIHLQTFKSLVLMNLISSKLMEPIFMW